MSGVNRQFINNWRMSDPAFSAAMAAAVALSTETLEDEAIRRAFEGVERPVLHKGRIITQTREFSDQLLMFLLRGRHPEKYGNKPQHTPSPQPQSDDTPRTPITVIDAMAQAESNAQELAALATRAIATYEVPKAGDYKGALTAAKTMPK